MSAERRLATDRAARRTTLAPAQSGALFCLLSPVTRAISQGVGTAPALHFPVWASAAASQVDTGPAPAGLFWSALPCPQKIDAKSHRYAAARLPESRALMHLTCQCNDVLPLPCPAPAGLFFSGGTTSGGGGVPAARPTRRRGRVSPKSSHRAKDANRTTCHCWFDVGISPSSFSRARSLFRTSSVTGICSSSPSWRAN